MQHRKVYIALPALREFENLESFLQCVENQTFKDIELVVCVNQPESWWENPEKQDSCLNNEQSIAFLTQKHTIPTTIIDKSSKGNGWSEKQKGVGIARKTLFDLICAKANPNDLVVSLDADTYFNENYIQSLVENFQKHPKALALSLPYYHPLTNCEEQDRALLRYEIYMRSYLLNLFRIGSPYSFTALGSGIVFPVSSYKKIRSIAPLEAGEDFYFLETFCKIGKVLLTNDEKVFPSGRISDRVPFGTGLAIKRGTTQDWNSYPIYSPQFFDDIAGTYQLFPKLFQEDTETPLTEFLQKQLKTIDLWSPLRKNFKTEALFMKACHQRLDGLRILQYLKQRTQQHIADEENTKTLLKIIFPENELANIKFDFQNFTFSNSPIEELNVLRDILAEKEMEYRNELIYTGL